MRETMSTHLGQMRLDLYPERLRENPSDWVAKVFERELMGKGAWLANKWVTSPVMRRKDEVQDEHAGGDERSDQRESEQGAMDLDFSSWDDGNVQACRAGLEDPQLPKKETDQSEDADESEGRSLAEVDSSNIAEDGSMIMSERHDSTMPGNVNVIADLTDDDDGFIPFGTQYSQLLARRTPNLKKSEQRALRPLLKQCGDRMVELEDFLNASAPDESIG